MVDLLAKHGPSGQRRVRVGAGKQALATAKCLLQGQSASLLEVQLLTGRTHQIRAQLSERSMPILGDRKYGGPDGERLLLHAWRVAFEDKAFELAPPWSGEFRWPRRPSPAWL